MNGEFSVDLPEAPDKSGVLRARIKYRSQTEMHERNIGDFESPAEARSDLEKHVLGRLKVAQIGLRFIPDSRRFSDFSNMVDQAYRLGEEEIRYSTRAEDDEPIGPLASEFLANERERLAEKIKGEFYVRIPEAPDEDDVLRYEIRYKGDKEDSGVEVASMFSRLYLSVGRFFARLIGRKKKPEEEPAPEKLVRVYEVDAKELNGDGLQVRKYIGENAQEVARIAQEGLPLVQDWPILRCRFHGDYGKLFREAFRLGKKATGRKAFEDTDTLLSILRYKRSAEDSESAARERDDESNPLNAAIHQLWLDACGPIQAQLYMMEGRNPSYSELQEHARNFGFDAPVDKVGIDFETNQTRYAPRGLRGTLLGTQTIYTKNGRKMGSIAGSAVRPPDPALKEVLSFGLAPT